MDILTGLALFGGGAVVGGMVMADFYASLKQAQDSERRRAHEQREAAARQMEMMDAQLQARTNALRNMETKRAVEASWCDGYEAGMREGMENAMQGVKLGDVVTMTRLRNARRLRSVNE